MASSDSSNRPSRKSRSREPAPRIVIFGGSGVGKSSTAYQSARELGGMLAKSGFVIVNGGYGGSMEALSRGAREAGGRTIGVTCPSVFETGRSRAKPNAYLDEILPARDAFARIERMIELGDGFLVLEGGTGTLMELATTWEMISKGMVRKRPIVTLGPTWNGLIDRFSKHRKSSRNTMHAVENNEAAVALLRKHAKVPRVNKKDNQAEPTISDDTVTIGYLKRVMERFVDERDWRSFHDPKNLSASIAIEAAELMEHFQWLRTDELQAVFNDKTKVSEIREEIADVLAYVLSFAETMGIDLSSALTQKMVKNIDKYPAEEFRGRFE